MSAGRYLNAMRRVEEEWGWADGYHQTLQGRLTKSALAQFTGRKFAALAGGFGKGDQRFHAADHAPVAAADAHDLASPEAKDSHFLTESQGPESQGPNAKDSHFPTVKAAV